MREYYKFSKLSQYLRDKDEDTITLSFLEIESILGEKMCKSAYNYQAYWSLFKTHTFPLAWINEGYILKSLDLKNTIIILDKVKLENAKPRISTRIDSNKVLYLDNYISQEKDIIVNVLKYYSETFKDENSRYNSWKHCHEYFLNNRFRTSEEITDNMCLHLAFYLASWGMYRGSSFLLKKDYKVHNEVVKEILKEKYTCLWDINCEDLRNKVDLVLEISEEIKKIYIKKRENLDDLEEVSNTLITKILMGTFGCVPAYDRFFKLGLKIKKVGIQMYNKTSLIELISFYEANKITFDECKLLVNKCGDNYSEMKLLDMYLWQIGYDNWNKQL